MSKILDVLVRDLYLRHTENLENGGTSVYDSYHRVWNKDIFLDSLRNSFAELEAKGKPRHTVVVISSAEYRSK